MQIQDKVAKAINKQINAELYSSYLYLSMSAYFEANNWLGMAHWMKLQAQEENVHAMKFYAYLFDRGAKPVLAAIDAPPKDWKSPLDAFSQAYSHELKVTVMINDILKLARKEEDAATESMLKWFIDEQVEEEASASLIVDKLRMIKDSINGMFMLDHELGQRK